MLLSGISSISRLVFGLTLVKLSLYLNAELRAEMLTREIANRGVSCGLDASLYVAEMKAGREAAEYLAKIMEYAWKRA